MRLIDAGFLLRSRPAGPTDAAFCLQLANHAVHAVSSLPLVLHYTCPLRTCKCYHAGRIRRFRVISIRRGYTHFPGRVCGVLHPSRRDMHMDGCRTQILFFKQPQGPSDGTAVFEGSQPVSLIDFICSGDTQGLHGVTGAILGTWGDCFTVVPMALATAVRQCARGGGGPKGGAGRGRG